MSTEGDPRDTVVGRAEAARDAYDHVPIPMARLDGPRHVFASCNAAYRAWVGLSEEALIGRPVGNVFPEVEGQQLLELIGRVYASGVAEHTRGWRLQLEGEDVDRYVDVLVTPYRDGDDRVSGLDCTIRDVTDETLTRLRAEDETRAARRGLHQMLDTVVTLQDALLPTALPVIPGVDVASRYLVAADEGSAGGDWFDALVRPDGHVALVVGDVVGHGVAAAAVMGQLRAVLHSELEGGRSIADSLSTLDRYAWPIEEAHATSVCVVDLDPETGEIEYCTAGHPPPLVVADSGEARFLPTSGTGPIATGSRYVTAHDVLDVADLLLLYTDGLIERPGRTPSAATVELQQVAVDTAMNRGLVRGAPRRRSERVCEVGLELLTRTGYADDVTMLAAQRIRPVAPLRVDTVAGSDALGLVRTELAQWLGELHVRSLDEMAIQHALAELVSNVVEHAYPGGGGSRQLSVQAAVDGRGVLACTVRDHGRWAPDGGDDGVAGDPGRGLAMVERFVDSLDIRPGEEGTEVTVRLRLSRNATLQTLHPSSTSRRGPEDDYAARVQGSTVRVQGPGDRDSVESLRHTLLMVRQGGLQSVDVDLTDVTLLGSAAVQLLHELVRDGSVTVRAEVGSVAQHVLDLVNLPYDTGAPE